MGTATVIPHVDDHIILCPRAEVSDRRVVAAGLAPDLGECASGPVLRRRQAA